MHLRKAAVSRLPEGFHLTLRRLLDSVVPERRQRQAIARTNELTAERVLARWETTGRVIGGPFAGMLMSTRTSWGSRFPYRSGSYEMELHGDLNEAIAHRPRVVIDIGCAEGYYAVGLARLLPDAHVYAFDVDPRARELCAELAELNDVAERVTVRGECTADSLAAIDLGTSLVIVDCEGCELTLLDPGVVDGLKSAVVIVEAHDFVEPSTSATLADRFAPSHDVRVVHAEPRTEVPTWIDDVTSEEFRVVANENRPTEPWPMRWLVMTPLSQSQR